MKILRLINSVNPKNGGPIEGIKQFAKPVQYAGHTEEILSLDAPNEEFIQQIGNQVHALGPALGSYGYSRKLIPWLEANHHAYDVIIIHGIWQYHSFAAHRVLKDKNIPYYVFTHGMLDPWFKQQYPLKHLKKCLYWWWGEYPVLRDAKKVLFTCEEEKILARQSFWPSHWNEQVVNYGTSGNEGDIEQQRKLFFNKFPHLVNKRCLLFLSRIHPKKGVDILIEAFAQTCQLQTDLHLVIAGPDQVGWQADLQRLAEKLAVTDKITWTGMLTGDLKWGAYLTSEVFILPSHQENFGIVVAEALSCGKPVLISNKVNIWREIEQDKAGYVDEDTLEGTLKNLQSWLNLGQSDKDKMIDAAKKCFLSRFHVENAANNLMALFEEDLNDNSRQ